MHVCVFWQLIGDKEAHAYACVRVFWQLMGEKVASVIQLNLLHLWIAIR